MRPMVANNGSAVPWPVTRISLSPHLNRRDLLRLEGCRPSRAHFDHVIDTSADAYDTETGRLVFRFRRHGIAADAVELARSIFGCIDARMRLSYYRKSAAGKIDLDRVRKVRPDVVAIEPVGADGFTGIFVLSSGKRLSEPLSNPVSSYMAGYNYDRYKMRGVPSGYSAKFPDEWARAVPFFESIGDCFDRVMPDESGHMRAWCREHGVAPRFTIGRTCLSTVAINVNYESCYHFDRGDLPSGYSTLTALASGGGYHGGSLVFPLYRVAVDIRDGDLLCNQSHIDLHGNMSVTPMTAGAKRVSFVTYLKKMLKHAGSKSGRPMGEHA